MTRNLTPVITLKNLLPPGRGPMLRDGPALAIWRQVNAETARSCNAYRGSENSDANF